MGVSNVINEVSACSTLWWWFPFGVQTAPSPEKWRGGFVMETRSILPRRWYAWTPRWRRDPLVEGSGAYVLERKRPMGRTGMAGNAAGVVSSVGVCALGCGPQMGSIGSVFRGR